MRDRYDPVEGGVTIGVVTLYRLSDPDVTSWPGFLFEDIHEHGELVERFVHVDRGRPFGILSAQEMLEPYAHFRWKPRSPVDIEALGD